jgi:hypothetical protein
MAVFILSASAIVGGMSYTCLRGERVTSYSVAPFSVLAHKQVEARNVQEARAALERFAAECEASGQPAECSAYFPRQSARKPAGFDDAKRRGELSRRVNLHAVTVTESAI